jgi:hypothetical protein
MSWWSKYCSTKATSVVTDVMGKIKMTNTSRLHLHSMNKTIKIYSLWLFIMHDRMTVKPGSKGNLNFSFNLPIGECNRDNVHSVHGGMLIVCSVTNKAIFLQKFLPLLIRVDLQLELDNLALLASHLAARSLQYKVYHIVKQLITRQHMGKEDNMKIRIALNLRKGCTNISKV